MSDTLHRITRRDFLRFGMAAGATLALTSCHSSNDDDDDNEPDSPSDPGSGSGSYGFRGFNVHPYQGALYSVQTKALRNIHATWIRTTLGLTGDIAGAYATSTGLNVLGIIGDFGTASISKSDWPAMVEAVVRRYPTIRYFQVLNEPEEFYNMSNTEYVRDYLRPAHDVIRQKFPSVKIVAAAPIGQPSGLNDFTEMSIAGADQYCDFRGVHVYYEQALYSPWSAYRVATQKPFMVTETGKRTASYHLSWWTQQIPAMKKALQTEYIFYYALLEQPTYTGYEIILADLDASGNVQPAPGSELYNYLKA